MQDLLRINIRQFDEGEGDNFSSFIDDEGNLDVEGIVSSYADEYTEETQVEETTSEETSGEVDESTELDDVTGESTQVQGEEKRTSDQAFAEMRRQIEQQEPLAKWVQELAVQQGFQNPQELISAFEDQKIAREAESQGVPVDVYKRLHELEKENTEQKEAVKSQNFNFEVEETKNKYDLSQEQLTEVFTFMAQKGYDPGAIPFEDAYVLANRDNLIKDAEERGRQSYLETKQKQQTQATPKIKTNSADAKVTGEIDYSKEAIFSHYKELGIDID